MNLVPWSTDCVVPVPHSGCYLLTLSIVSELRLVHRYSGWKTLEFAVQNESQSVASITTITTTTATTTTTAAATATTAAAAAATI